MILAQFFWMLSCGVWWCLARSNPRERDKALRLLASENDLPGQPAGYDSQHSRSAVAFPALSADRVMLRKHRKHPISFGDYDVIEVIQNGSMLDYGEEIGFSAVKEKFCAAECIRGLSGLCICPPPDTPAPRTDVSLITTSRPPTPAFTLSSRHTPLHQRQTARERTNKKMDSYFALSEEEPPALPTDMTSVGMESQHRVKRGDDDDEEDQKLCKCRRCRKLFKRTLYCRVFPCYQKKCKSGEWKTTDRESTPSTAH